MAIRSPPTPELIHHQPPRKGLLGYQRTTTKGEPMRMKTEFKSREGFWIDPARIEVEKGFNKRLETPDYLEYLADLKELIRANGVTDPITCRAEGEHVILVHGHGRLRSVLALIEEGVEFGKLPVQMVQAGTDPAERLASQVVQNTGRPFSMLEKSNVVKGLKKYNWSDEEIARRLRLSLTTVQSLLTLQECDPDVKAQVQNGNVSASLAIQVQKESPSDAPAILQEAQEIAQASGLTRTAPKHVKAAMEARAETHGGPAPIDWAKIGPKALNCLEALLDGRSCASKRARTFLDGLKAM